MAYVTPGIINMLKAMEGLEFKSYNDVGGLGTIGYGHLIKEDEEDLRGRTLSKEEAEELLKKDIAEHQDPWMKNLRVNADEGQIAALTSLAFNSGAFGPVQKAVELMNAGKNAEAAEYIQVYNKAKIDGVYTHVKGLDDRRKFEGKLITGQLKSDDLAGSWHNRKSILADNIFKKVDNFLTDALTPNFDVLRLKKKRTMGKEGTYKSLPQGKTEDSVLAQLRALNKTLGSNVQEMNWNTRILQEGRGWPV